MNVIINPGSGPVDNATCRVATANMRAFRRDVGYAVGTSQRFHLTFGRFGAIVHGRYGFRLNHSKRHVFIEMPGIALDRVRYVHAKGQDAWDFPRLYVNGSSWLWEFAVPQAVEALGFKSAAEAFRDKRDAGTLVWP